MTRLQSDLLLEARNSCEHLIDSAKQHARRTSEELNATPAPGKWNVLQCYEHMNLYGALYLGYLQEAINKGKALPADRSYRAGWLGGWSARSMLPKEGKLSMPMKTFKKMDPDGDGLKSEVIHRFIKDHETLLGLLADMEAIDIQRTKSKTTIPGLRFRLGDTVEFFLNHNRRHIWQAERVLIAQR